MSEAQRLYTQWRNMNESNKYPFSMRATLSNGSVSIPAETFIDARIYPSGGGVGQYISMIEKTSDQIKITIADAVNGDMASCTIVISDIVTYDVKLVTLFDDLGRTAGVLVTEPARIGLLTAMPIGIHLFTLDQTEFTASVVTPMPSSGLRSLVVDGTAHTGDVWLVGGLGVTLSYAHVSGEDQVTINVVGEPLSKRVGCTEEVGEFPTPRFISTIGLGAIEILPDQFGDFKIAVCGMDVDDTVLRVFPTSDGITFAVIGGRVG